MAKFAKIAAYINLAGDRNNVVHRSGAEALTLPEAYVLMALHGGPEHVYDLVVEGHDNRDMDAERERLVLIYGEAVVDKVFPTIAGRVMLPATDDKLPTTEEIAASQAAQADAVAKVRARRAKAEKPVGEPAPEPAPVPFPVPDALPPLDALPE